MLKVWNLSLVMLTFTLAIFGTFVVRSGVLSSVHAFATSAIGPYFFVFLGLVILGSAALIFFRTPKLQTEGHFDSLLSRESSFLVNNLLVIGVTAATFWGSIFPLISEVFTGAKISVGPPFYNQVNGPILLALVILMGIGPLLAWRRSAPSALWRNVRWPVALGAIAGLGLFALGVRQPLAVLSYASVAFVFGTIWVEFYRGTRVRARNTGESFPVALVGLVSRNRRRYGGYLVHLALLLVAIGVISSVFFQQESAATVPTGKSLSVGRYTITNGGLFSYEKPGMVGTYAKIAITRDGRNAGAVYPEKRTYRGWENQPVTGVGIQTGLPNMEDVYVLLTSIDEKGVPTFRVFINPLVSFIWLGGVLLLMGTVLAGWPEVQRSERPVRAMLGEAVRGEA